jgi:Trypsin-co-occurring domain 1
MAKSLVQAQTSDGGTISFAVDDVTGVGPERVSRENGTVVAKLDEPLDKAIASARPATETIFNTFRGLSPDELTIEFGLSVDAQAGAVIAKAGIGAHFNITMRWAPPIPGEVHTPPG